MFARLKRKKKEAARPPGKDQPSVFRGVPDFRDLLAPSVIREVAPGASSLRGRADAYWVEVGATVEPVRYFRCFHAVVTGATRAGMLSPLYTGEIGEADCDVAVHVVPADPVRTVWELEQKIAQLEADFAEEKNSARRSTLLRQIRQLQERHGAVRSGEEKLFFVSVQAAVSSTNLEAFRRSCALLVRKMAARGIHMRAADTRQLRALFEMTPLDGSALRDTYRDMETSHVADLLPFGLGGLRHRSGVVLGVEPATGSLVLYDCWHPEMGNYNIVVFGRAGFGKSFLIKLLTARSTPLGVRTAIVDPEREYENLMVGLGCPYIRLDPSSKDRINIFDVDLVEEDDGTVRVDLDGAVQAVQAVVFKMLRLYDPGVLTGRVKVLLQDKIRELYARRGITEDPRSLYEAAWTGEALEVEGRLKRMPTLSDLHDLMERDPDLKVAAELLKPFTRKGGSPAQAVFDCESTVDVSGAPAFAFSVAGLEEEFMRPLGLFVAAKWVWEKFGRDRRVRKRIVVDEAQLAMDTPETAKWLEDCFRRARKRNISMCAGTQGFEVFLRVPEGLGILKNSSTKFFMRQEALDIEAVREKFQLSEGEAEFLLTCGRGFGIVRADNDASVFYAKPMDVEYRWFTSDPNELQFLRERG